MTNYKTEELLFKTANIIDDTFGKISKIFNSIKKSGVFSDTTSESIQITLSIEQIIELLKSNNLIFKGKRSDNYNKKI